MKNVLIESNVNNYLHDEIERDNENYLNTNCNGKIHEIIHIENKNYYDLNDEIDLEIDKSVCIDSSGGCCCHDNQLRDFC